MARSWRTTLSTLDFRIFDQNAAHAGVSLWQLMQNAARALAEEVQRLGAQRVLIVCGPGNNGGDGMAMAPLVATFADVRVLLSHDPGEIRQDEANEAYEGLLRRNFRVEVYRTPERLRELCSGADLVVDALLGSGTQGELREPIRSIVKVLNRSRQPILSVDVPTGLGSQHAVRPRVTVALHAKKPGTTRANSGRLRVRDIGIPKAAIDDVGPADFFLAYPRNPAESHKGNNGRLLVVAGGPYTGAPILCASAALRTGIDLVHLCAPVEAARAAQTRLPDLIVHPGVERRRLVPEDVRRIQPLLRRVDAVLIGPGLGETKDTQQAIEALLGEAAKARVRVVLDADAIGVAGADARLAARTRPLVTPHHGEFKEYTGKSVPKDEASARRTVAQEARRMRSTLLVKGAVDLISDGERTKGNRIHHSSMTTGGTGDVLAGLCAGFVAKGMEPFRAACAAAFVNGWTGRHVAQRQGGSLVASDLVRALPATFRAWL